MKININESNEEEEPVLELVRAVSTPQNVACLRCNGITGWDVIPAVNEGMEEAHHWCLNDSCGEEFIVERKLESEGDKK